MGPEPGVPPGGGPYGRGGGVTVDGVWEIAAAAARIISFEVPKRCAGSLARPRASTGSRGPPVIGGGWVRCAVMMPASVLDGNGTEPVTDS